MASWLLLVLGLALLVAGGEALVRGASGIALLGRLSPSVVGLTVVAAGTSMPELVVSMRAALEGNTGIAVGNIVGSNIFNIAAVLGVAALIRPLVIRGNTVRLEWPVMFLATLGMVMLVRDGTLDRVEGTVFLAGFVGFTAYSLWIARSAALPDEREQLGELTTASFGQTGLRAWGFNGLAVIIGVALLAVGSSVLVSGASAIAAALGVSDSIVGLTIVAAGTSAPELTASAVASWRGKDDMAVANVIGSNIFNVLGIAGVTAILQPLPVAAEIAVRDNLWMLGLTCVLLPLMRTGSRINRWEGAFLLACFSVYWGTLLLGASA